MKKILVALLLGLLFLSLVGCTDEEIAMWDAVLDQLRTPKPHDLPFDIEEEVTTTEMI